MGLDVSNADIYDAINGTVIGEKGFSFVINKNGEIIFSSLDEGNFSTRVDNGDLRQNASNSLADAAKNMVDGKSGIQLLKINDEHFYIAYAPMPSVG